MAELRIEKTRGQREGMTVPAIIFHSYLRMPKVIELCHYVLSWSAKNSCLMKNKKTNKPKSYVPSWELEKSLSFKLFQWMKKNQTFFKIARAENGLVGVCCCC